MHGACWRGSTFNTLLVSMLLLRMGDCSQALVTSGDFFVSVQSECRFGFGIGVCPAEDKMSLADDT